MESTAGANRIRQAWHILARLTSIKKELNMRRKGNWHTQHVVKKRQVINQQLIAVEEEFNLLAPKFYI
jgi:hypothetical protein